MYRAFFIVQKLKALQLQGLGMSISKGMI